MANYLTSFDTYAEYSAATLNLPNVSLIKNTGEVYYKNIYAGAVLGDILMWDVTNQKLVSTFDAQWDSSTYPIASYEPIAINVYPADQASDGKSRWMALKWASNASASGSTNNVSLMWGPNGNDITSTDTTALNGRANTNKVISIMPNTSGNTQAECPIFYAVNQFCTNGTSAGDWYVPSYAELSLYKNNQSDINAKITAIRNASSSIVNTVSGEQWTSTEESREANAWVFNQPYSYQRSTKLGVRGMIAL